MSVFYGPGGKGLADLTRSKNSDLHTCSAWPCQMVDHSGSRIKCLVTGCSDPDGCARAAGGTAAGAPRPPTRTSLPRARTASARVLPVPPPGGHERTLFVLWGDWFAWVAVALLLLCLLQLVRSHLGRNTP